MKKTCDICERPAAWYWKDGAFCVECWNKAPVEFNWFSFWITLALIVVAGIYVLAKGH